MTAAIRIGCATIALFFGGFGGWAALAPLDGAVVANGQLALVGDRVAIVLPAGSVVAGAPVQNGEHVRQGQIVLRLDGGALRASLADQQIAVYNQQLVAARDIAEISDARTVAFPAAPGISLKREAEAVARQTLLFRAYATTAMAPQSNRVNRVDASREGVGLSGNCSGTSIRLRVALQEAAARELYEAQEKIDMIQDRIAVQRGLLARLDITAPVSGQIENLAATPGAPFDSARPIANIVPDTAVVVAQVPIKPENIAVLQPGQSATVLALGLHERRAQPVAGIIAAISATETDPRTGEAFYVASIRLTGNSAGLLAGTPVEVIVRVKPRTALEYLLEPLRESLRNTGNET